MYVCVLLSRIRSEAATSELSELMQSESGLQFGDAATKLIWRAFAFSYRLLFVFKLSAMKSPTRSTVDNLAHGTLTKFGISFVKVAMPMVLRQNSFRFCDDMQAAAFMIPTA